MQEKVSLNTSEEIKTSVDEIINKINEIESKNNLLDDYIKETRKLEDIFHYYEYKDGYYSQCDECKGKNKCKLIKRINKEGKLKNRLPDEISNIINEHYMSILKI